MDNRDKDKPLDESIVDQEPPNINEPQSDPEDEKDPTPDPEPEIEGDEHGEDEPQPPTETKTEEATPLPKKTESEETEEQREQRYKAQQTETQIQAARNRALTDKVEEAAKIGEPTTEELKQYALSKGAEWDDLTPFEQALAKDTLIANKRFSAVNDAVQTTKQIDAWAQKVDTFIDETEDKPEFAKLSSHEADFRKFAMKESHRGTPIDILLGAFLHQLPAPKKIRGALFEKAGGGEKPQSPGKITDTDDARTLRETNPREFRRKLKAGLIQIEA